MCCVIVAKPYHVGAVTGKIQFGILDVRQIFIILQMEIEN